MFLLGSASGGGAERVVSHLIRHIDRREFDPRVGLLSREGPYLPDFETSDLLVPKLMHGWMSYRERPSWWRLVPAAAVVPLQQRELIQRFRPHVIVTVTKSMNLAARVSLGLVSGREVAWIAREGNNTGAMIDGESTIAAARWIQNALVRRSYRRADRVVVISDGVGSGLAHRFRIDPARVRTIYNGVDVTAIQQRAAESLPVPSDRSFIVAAGRLTAQKGFDVLIRAYAARARVGGRGVALVILGEGAERPRLEQLARDLGVKDGVSLPGFVSNPWAYFARAAMFVSSSRWEGFGNVIVEAMAAGTPVVATDCDFGPREIVDDGRSGLLVPVDNADALGAAMARLLDDRSLACALSAAGRLRANDFDVRTMAQAYEETFREVIKVKS